MIELTVYRYNRKDKLLTNDDGSRNLFSAFILNYNED